MSVNIVELDHPVCYHGNRCKWWWWFWTVKVCDVLSSSQCLKEHSNIYQQQLTSGFQCVSEVHSGSSYCYWEVGGQPGAASSWVSTLDWAATRRYSCVHTHTHTHSGFIMEWRAAFCCELDERGVTYLSPDTVIRCLQSLLNFIPVTISETHTHTPTFQQLLDHQDSNIMYTQTYMDTK